MALRERRVIGAHDEREVRELRRRKPEGLIEQHLPWRVRDVIFTADHVRHLHQRIVDHDGEVVLGTPVGSDEHRIADHVRVERHFAADEIVEGDVHVLGHAKADDGPFAGVDPSLGFVGTDRSAGTGVPRRLAFLEHALAVFLELLGRTEAVVGVAGGQQLVRVRGVQVQPLRLAIRSARPTHVGAFVPLESKPAQILEDAVLRRLGGSLGVGVLDAQDERPVVTACEQPVEERRARVADVQLARWTRSEAYRIMPLRRPRSFVHARRRHDARCHSSLSQKRDRVRRNRLAASDGVDALVRLGLEADPRRDPRPARPPSRCACSRCDPRASALRGSR